MEHLKDGQEVFIRAKVLGTHGPRVRVQIAHSGGVLVGELRSGPVLLASSLTLEQETTPILDFQETTPILDE